MTTFIYALKEPDTGEIRYIGKTDYPKKRLLAQIAISAREKSHLSSWICSLAARGLKPDQEIIDEVSKDLWESAECGYIHWYRSLGFDLVNGTPGGDGGSGASGENHPMFGKHLSLSSKEKIRAALLGKPRSLEAVEKSAASRRGKPRSEETRKKISLGHLGNKNPMFGKPAHNRGISPSLETRKKMSASAKGKRLSELTRKKISSTCTGRKKSDETRHNMRLAQLKRRELERESGGGLLLV